MGAVGILIAAGFVLVLTSLVRQGLRSWRRRRLLAQQSALDDAEFGKRFGGDSLRASQAIRLRRLLETNLRCDLRGLRPDMRLREDLDLEPEANPHLFWEIEAEFGIKSDVGDWESHERALASMQTVRHLLEYVAARVALADPQASRCRSETA